MKRARYRVVVEVVFLTELILLARDERNGVCRADRSPRTGREKVDFLFGDQKERLLIKVRANGTLGTKVGRAMF